MLNMLFSVTNNSELHMPISFTIIVLFYQVKMLTFYNVQTINLTFVGKTWDVQ